MSKVKAGGSTNNNRDSESKRLGAKLGDGQFANAGAIIFRQRGTKIHPGKNVGRGGDDTLFALITGYVKYEKRRNRTYANVYEERIVIPKKVKATSSSVRKDKKTSTVKKPKVTPTKK